MAENKFLTSVADVKLYDDITNDLILNGKTLINSSMTQSIQSQAVYGGKGSQKLFEFNYQKELAFTIEDAVFNASYISLQNNTKVLQELTDYYTDEYVVLDASGEGELTEAPVGNIHIQTEDGSHIQIVPNGKKFTYLPLAKTEVRVSYAYKELMDTVSISASSFPKAVRLVLNGDIMTNNGKEEEMQILVHKFKPDGALELTLSHDGVSTSSLAGTALANGKGEYAKISFKKVGSDDIKLVKISASPAEVDLDSSVPNDSEQLSVYGIRGDNTVILLDNTKLTFVSDDPLIATVDTNGLITLAGTATATDTTMIRISDGSNIDIVEVTII